MFFVNNYFKADISIAMNTLSSDDIEFAIVSYKYPAEIAHNFLHLYGAAICTQQFSGEIVKKPETGSNVSKRNYA
jgi:hypothetical protein